MLDNLSLFPLGGSKSACHNAAPQGFVLLLGRIAQGLFSTRRQIQILGELLKLIGGEVVPCSANAILKMALAINQGLLDFAAKQIQDN